MLQKQFGVLVCDNCRRKNDNGKYTLVTKTEAKQEYLLLDTDLDVQFEGLRCIEKKNPHNERWGIMKLYLRYQVEKISYERYGGEQGLEEEIAKRFADKQKLQEKRQKNKVTKLRKQTLTSLWRTPDETHEHKYGEEQECSDGDDEGMWKKVCETCGFVLTFEKM